MTAMERQSIIFYFSGTGNAAHVAQWVAGQEGPASPPPARSFGIYVSHSTPCSSSDPLP